MPAHAQTPDLSLPALPDIGAGLDLPGAPAAADVVPSAPAANTPKDTVSPAPVGTVGTRASADAIDDLLPPVASKPATTSPAPTEPAIATTDAPAAPTETTSLPAVADAPKQQPSLPPLPDTALAADIDTPLKPPSLAEEAAAKGVKPPTLELPPMPEATAQALLSGQPLGIEGEEEPETPLVVVKRKPTVRDLPRLRPSITPLRHTFNYQRQMLPPSIYKRDYAPENRHLPKATTREDYDRHLFGAVAANNVNATRAFLNMGKNVNLVNANGETLLMTAIRYGAVDTARLLLARGADPRASGAGGMTPLQLAQSSGQHTLVEVLLARGA